MKLFSWFQKNTKSVRSLVRRGPDPFLFPIYEAFRNDSTEMLLAAVEGKELGNFRDDRCENHWLGEAMKNSVSVNMLQQLIDLGVDPHAYPSHGGFSPLARAVALERLDYLAFLLERGVDPNDHLIESRITLAAVNERFNADRQIEILKLLIEHNVDLNAEFPWFGDQSQTVSVLDHATDETVKEFLREHGARTSAKPVTNPYDALKKSLED